VEAVSVKAAKAIFDEVNRIAGANGDRNSKYNTAKLILSKLLRQPNEQSVKANAAPDIALSLIENTVYSTLEIVDIWATDNNNAVIPFMSPGSPPGKLMPMGAGKDRKVIFQENQTPKTPQYQLKSGEANGAGAITVSQLQRVSIEDVNIQEEENNEREKNIKAC